MPKAIDLHVHLPTEEWLRQSIGPYLPATEAYFRAHAIDSIETYRTRRAAGRADDGYGDVFLVVDGWSTLRADFDDLEMEIQQLSTRGLTFGLHIVAATSRWMYSASRSWRKTCSVTAARSCTIRSFAINADNRTRLKSKLASLRSSSAGR